MSFPLSQLRAPARLTRAGRWHAIPSCASPLAPSSAVQVTAPAAAAVLDLGNAIYALTPRLLAQAWSARGVQPADKAVPAAALNAAMQLMRVLGGIGMHLCCLPADDAVPGMHAGLTFTVLRATEPLVKMAELLLGLKIVSALQTPLRRLFPLLEEIAATFAEETVGRTPV